MRMFRFLPLVVVLALGTLGLSIFALQSAEESAATAEGVAKSPVPASHQALLKALRKIRELNYEQQGLDDCIADLARTMGVEIQLHESVKKAIQHTGPIDLYAEIPVSHQTAIHLVLQQFSVYEYGIAFDEDKLTIVRGEDYQGLFLRTYSLMGRSDFSIAERRRWIESTLTDVHPDLWTVANKTWIQPGESIFEVDVYQNQKVHDEIAKRMSNQHGLFVVDQDIQGLSPFGFLNPEESEKGFDKKAAVERLRRKYAFQSITDRLQYETGEKQTEAPKLSPAAQERVRLANEEFEKENSAEYSFSNIRSRSLRMLHEDEVEAFVNRPGAGLSRMPTPGPSYLQEGSPPDLPLASNAMIRTSDDVPMILPATRAAASTREVELPSEESLLEFHQQGGEAFLSPQSFGLIKNRNQVAGFQSHGFSFAPQLQSHIDRPWYRKEKEVWAIHRLELVSLLKQEKPAVYVSKNLPRMDKLQAAPTRPLNRFEQSGLLRLREGEDVITNGSLNRIEMIGALRATKQCQQCHNVQSGALLGAFSYELLRDPQIDPQKHREKNRNKPVL